MAMRPVAQSYGWEIHCHRQVLTAQVTPTARMPTIVGALPVDKQRSIMQWITKHGPFWDLAREHASEDYLECMGEVVTDSAIGEAGYCTILGLDYRLVSLVPSLWDFTPLQVQFWGNDRESALVGVANYRDIDELRGALQDALPPIRHWQDLASRCRGHFAGLDFAPDAFLALATCPYSVAGANQIMARLRVLDDMTRCWEADGSRSQVGLCLYRDFFTGDNGWFSDSSDSEKHEFRGALTFPDPHGTGVGRFCPWHGKVRPQVLRLHFSWPIHAGERVYVAYVGPKLTKR